MLIIDNKRNVHLFMLEGVAHIGACVAYMVTWFKYGANIKSNYGLVGQIL